MKFKRGIATLGIAAAIATGTTVVSEVAKPAEAQAIAWGGACRSSASFWDRNYNMCWKQLRIPRPDWRRYP